MMIMLGMPMEIRLSKNFRKKFKKADKSIQEAFLRRVDLFQQDPHLAILKNHSLTGKWKHYRSINVTGDWRAVFKIQEKNGAVVIMFETIGTHSQLYR